ncbi:MAG: (2Fe-2S)-binding protein [Dehalococcoidales bacterium]|nr:MAG: (2Fe-2S)-binding protein [Dehalococcoidales bacterium]
MRTVSLTIDGQQITAREGDNLLWVALDNGIYIPNLCAIRDKSEPMASCRLCFVEVEGKEQPVTACTETVTEGMIVNTRGTRALSLARRSFELLMASHSLDCAHCPKSGSCELQHIARYLGTRLKSKQLRELRRDLPIDDSHPQIIYDPNKCVLCGRCIWTCREHLGVGVLGFAHRGFQRMVTTFEDEPLAISKCDRCVECIGVCPTGALLPRNETKTRVTSES